MGEPRTSGDVSTVGFFVLLILVFWLYNDLIENWIIDM